MDTSTFGPVGILAIGFPTDRIPAEVVDDVAESQEHLMPIRRVGRPGLLGTAAARTAMATLLD